MNDIFYLIIIIGLTIFMIFYGGHNCQNKIEYNIDSEFFKVLNLIKHLENKLKKFNNQIEFKDSNFININNNILIYNIVILNFINYFFIKINSY